MILPSLQPLIASSVGYAFDKSDEIGKFIVLLLVFISVIVWCFIFIKGVALQKAKKASEVFINKFREKRHSLAIISDPLHQESPVSDIYAEGAAKVLEFTNLDPEQALHYGSPNFPTQKLSPAELEAIHSIIEQEVSNQILKLEHGIDWLATAVSVCPFLGLFGTVYGVMTAFVGIASKGSPEINALAPGVSGALLTTVVGLMVAIPSLVGYNMLKINIRKLTVFMDNFTEEFIAKIKIDQLSGGQL